MNVSLQIESGHVEVQFASMADVDPETQQLVIRVSSGADDQVPTKELSRHLRLRDVEHGTVFSCVASADDETAEPTLFFDAKVENAQRPARVEFLWCRDGEQSLGFLDCRAEAMAMERPTGGIAREPVEPPELPPGIVVEELADGVRYRLPKRPYPDVKPPRQWVYNLCFILVGLGWASVVAGGMVSAANNLPRSVEPNPVLRAIAILFGSVLAIPGLAPLAIWCYGLWLDRGSEIELRGDQLAFADFIGPFRWRRGSHSVDPITQLAVVGPDHVAGRQIHRTNNNKSAIVANVPGLFQFAWGYPTRWLFPLAEHLARRVTIARREIGPRNRRTRTGNQVDLEVFDNVNPAEFHRDVRLQPEDSQATVENTDDGLILAVPPDRHIVRRARESRAVCRGALVVAVVLSLALLTVIWLGFPHPAAIGGSGLLGAINVSVWCFGVGSSLDMSRRQNGCLVAKVTEGRLRIIDTARFPGTNREWNPDQIAVIVVGPARLDSLNGDDKTDGHELQIHLHDGEVIGLLDGHAYEELAWIATLLRKTLAVRAINPPNFANEITA